MRQAGPDAGPPSRLSAAGEAVVAALAEQVVAHAKGQPARHCVVIGGFGSGKTHCLTAGMERAGHDLTPPDLAESWVPMGAIVTSYADLLREIAIGLADGEDAPDVVTRQAHQTRQIRALERFVLDELPAGRRLVVVVEDIDELLDQLPVTDRDALLSLLRRKSGPLVLASSSTALGPDVPFSPLTLRPLSLAEALAVAERTLPEERADVAAFNELVHGNARFWAIAARHLAAGEPDALNRAYHTFLDLLEIRFTERLRMLAPSERRAVVQLARAGRPQTVGEIADLLGVSNQSVASTLGRLTAGGWVQNVEAAPGADRRLRWYDVSDPLLRLHILRPSQSSAAAFVREVRHEWHRQHVTELRPESEPVAVDVLEQRAAQLGSTGHAAAARDLYRRSLLRRIATEGLSSPATVRTFTEFAVWTTTAGGDRGGAMVQAAARDAERIVGRNSAEWFAAAIHLGWQHINRGEHDKAVAVFDDVIKRAKRVGPDAIGTLLLARQNRARAIGEQGNPAAAAQELAEVLDARLKLHPTDVYGIRTNRHGLAWWTGEAGDPARAVRMFDEMLENPDAHEYEKLHYRKDAARWAGAMDPAAAVRRLMDLSKDIARSPYANDYVARDTNRDALKWSLAVPVDVDRLPTSGVHPFDFAAMLSAEIVEGRLTLTDIARLPATREQADALAIRCVFSAQPRPPGWRSEAAVALAARMSPAKAALVLDFGRALAGESRAESGLPAEWRPIIVGLRAIDATVDSQE